MTRYFLILNPGSKGGSSNRKIDTILEAFKAHNATFDHAVTRNLNDAYNLSVDANRNNYDAVIAVGGDGTINRVLNGFFDEQGNRISKAVMGIIYTGTSPDFCKTYNIPTSINKAIEVVFQNKTRQIPVGRIILCKEKKVENINVHLDGISATEKEVNYFACCVNIGIGADVARRANSGIRKYLGDFSGTFVSMLTALVKYKPSDFFIVKDNQQESIHNLFNMSIGLTKFIASGIKVNHELNEKPNQFYNLAIKELTLLKTPSIISTIYSGEKINNDRNIELSYSSKIKIAGNVNSDIEFDGDPYGFLPCSVELAKDKLEIFIEYSVLQ